MNAIKITETTLEMPTYRWTEDGEPALIREFTPRNQPIYPYTIQDGIAKEKESCRYRAVILENEYLKLTFLPDLNGRLYSAYDKIAEAELFYGNPVVKPALFGLRGAWVAAGIECNFPNSHSTTTLEPVSWRIARGEDGSVSFLCGNVERVSRMGWSVAVTLRPAGRLIELETRLCNLTELPQRYYYWVNSAIPVYDQTQFIYPESMHYLYTHPPMDISRIAYLEYPIHEGVDISYFKNINQLYPVFAAEMTEDFFGLYHHHLGRGLVHVADRALVRGRKIWSFGRARDGRISIDLLSEDGSDYCELQSGPFTLQSDYRLMAPGKEHIQKEAWYAVGALGGFNAACKDLAANIRVKDDLIEIKMHATRRLADLNIRMKEDRRTTGEKKIDLSPGQVETIKLPRQGERVEFFEAGGMILDYWFLAERKSITVAPVPQERPQLLRGRYLEEQGYRRDALAAYASDKSLEAKVARARLLMQMGKYETALLEEVLAVDREHVDACYLLGICFKKLGKLKEAEHQFSCLIDSAASNENALLQLAKLAVMGQDYPRAWTRLEHLNKPTSLRMFVSRKMGRQSAEVKGLFPFDPLACGERFLGGDLTAIADKDPQYILEIVCCYLELRAFDDALAIIDTCLKNGTSTTMFHYYRNYIHRQLKLKSGPTEALDEFPFRLEEEQILQAALEPLAAYQLGNLLAYLGRWEDAVPYWEKAENNGHALRNQGLYYWRIKKDLKLAVGKYAAAVSRKDCTAKTIWEYDCLLEEAGMERISLLEEKLGEYGRDQRLLLRLASAYVGAGRYKEALQILQDNKFKLCEGKILPRLLYEEACGMLGQTALEKGDFENALFYYKLPLSYPENLGVGKPARNMEAEWWWHCGCVFMKMGDKVKGMENFSSGAKEGTGIDIKFFPLQTIIWEHGTDGIDIGYWVNLFFRGMCSRKTGSESTFKDIVSFIERRKGREPEIKLLKSLILYCEGDRKTALRQCPAGYHRFRALMAEPC